MRKLMVLLLLIAAFHTAAHADTIPLQATQTATRIVELTWTETVPTAVLRRFPGQTSDVQIATVTGNHYTDHHRRAVCDDTVYYTIVQQSAGSEHRGYAAVNVADLDATASAEWGIVTVDPSTQQIVLQWEPSPDTDIVGYLVCEGSPSIVVDTVFGSANTTYTYADGDPEEIYYFRLVAFDSCRLASALTDVCCNMTLELKTLPCSRTVTATWNSYQNMPGGLQSYELWVSEDGSSPRCVAVVHDNESTAVQFEVAEQTMTVSAYVKALGSSSEAYSIRRQATFSTTERPDRFYLRKVSVSDDGSAVTVVSQTDPTFSGSDYRVYRSVAGGPATVAGHCSPSADGTLTWTDRGAQPKSEVYTYWMGVNDGCDRNEITTSKGSTLLLGIEAQGVDATVEWNPYEGWTGSTTYELLQAPIGSDSWTQAAFTASQEAVASSGDESAGPRQYKVIAHEGDNSQWQRGDTLQSAVFFHRPRTTLWMPNAFTPHESTNQRFGPRFTFIDPDGYSFVIYNRQGLEVFGTSDPAAEWDGTFRGHTLPAGAYVYKITYRQSDGTEQQVTGTVLMIY